MAIIEKLIELQNSGGWNFIGVIIYFSFILILLLIDAALKTFSKVNTLFLWLIEIGIITNYSFGFFKLEN